MGSAYPKGETYNFKTNSFYVVTGSSGNFKKETDPADVCVTSMSKNKCDGPEIKAGAGDFKYSVYGYTRGDNLKAELAKKNINKMGVRFVFDLSGFEDANTTYNLLLTKEAKPSDDPKSKYAEMTLTSTALTHDFGTAN